MCESIKILICFFKIDNNYLPEEVQKNEIFRFTYCIFLCPILEINLHTNRVEVSKNVLSCE